jgi:drug/metabolite transporter (DMT)-like permease
VTAAVLGVLLLGERLRPQALVGVALIAAGLLILTLRRPAGSSSTDDEGEQRATIEKRWR